MFIDHIRPDAPFRVIKMIEREEIQAYWQSPVEHHSQLLNGPWVGLSLRDFEAIRPELFINLAEFYINSLKMGSVTKGGFYP